MSHAEPASMLHATALLETGDAPCTALPRGSEVLELHFDHEVPTTRTLRLAFRHRGEHPGLVQVLTAIEGSHSEPGGMRMDARPLALHSTAGKECLREFLLRDLGHDRIDEQAFRTGAGGWFYGLRTGRPSAGSEAERVQRQNGHVVDTQRREPRVAVRVPLVFVVGEQRYQGQAYNISYNGLYVLTEEILPEEGTSIEVHYPLEAREGGRGEVTLFGEVMWTMSSMTSPTGGGIGIRIQRIDDGADGATWQDYIVWEMEFGGAAPRSAGTS